MKYHQYKRPSALHKSSNQPNTRAIAANILAEVIGDQHSLTDLFQQQIPASLDERDRGLVKEYCYGVLRWYERLKIIAKPLIYKPLKSRDLDIAILLLIGLYQIIYLKTPAHAAVSETVEAAQVLKKTWAKGLINQALQQFLRRQEFLLTSVDTTEAGKFSHPQWMIDAIRSAWPQAWEAVLLENNQQAPLFLRVNLQKNSCAAYQQLLKDQQIEADLIEGFTCGINVKAGPASRTSAGF